MSLGKSKKTYSKKRKTKHRAMIIDMQQIACSGAVIEHVEYESGNLAYFMVRNLPAHLTLIECTPAHGRSHH